MKKINLNQKILTIRGEPIKNPEFDEKGQPIIEKGKQKMKIMRLRDYLLTILGTRFPVLNTKEVFWTTELGTLIASETKIVGGKVDDDGHRIGGKEVPNIEIEISDDKAKFLYRILENNKIKQQLPMGGEREIELFFPYELSQLLRLLIDEKELKEIEEKTKE